MAVVCDSAHHVHVVEGAVPVSARVCDFDPRKTCLAELGGLGKESERRGLSSQKN